MWKRLNTEKHQSRTVIFWSWKETTQDVWGHEAKWIYWHPGPEAEVSTANDPAWCASVLLKINKIGAKEKYSFKFPPPGVRHSTSTHQQFQQTQSILQDVSERLKCREVATKRGTLSIGVFTVRGVSEADPVIRAEVKCTHTYSLILSLWQCIFLVDFYSPFFI